MILRDARTLMGLGISRHLLGEAIQAALRLRDADSRASLHGTVPLVVNETRFRGHHQDPFHDDDTFYWIREVRGSADCSILNTRTGETLALSDMAPYLIRRACLFEGTVHYRVDPAVACRVLAPLLQGAAR